MEENKTVEMAENVSADERLKALADKNGKSVEELLNDLEERQSVLDENETTASQSIGSQSKNAKDFFDPAGTEFLKGLWGK